MSISCTIVIPTKSRYNHLCALLDHYVNTKFSGSIYICDSSEYSRESELVNKYKNAPFILKYYYILGWPWQVIKKVLHLIDTDYVIYSGDDDYIIVDSLIRLIEFLDAPGSAEFQGAIGHSYLLFSNKNTAFDNIVRYNAGPRLENSAKERVQSLLSNYSVPLFSLFRKKTFVSAVAAVDLDSSKWVRSTQFINDEILISCMLVAYGKISFVNQNFVIRNVHPQRYILSQDSIPHDFYNYAVSYFVAQVNNAVLQNDLGLLGDQAKNINQSFEFYMDRKAERGARLANECLPQISSSITCRQRLRIYLTRNNFLMYLYILFRLKKLRVTNVFSLALTCYKIYIALPTHKY